MKKILAIMLCLMLLTGCTKDNTSESRTSDQPIVPNLISLSTDDAKYWYIIDKNTHVVYLRCDSLYRAALTVMLKADGTPMLAEDLGIEVK